MLRQIFPYLTDEQEEQITEVFELTDQTYFTGALVKNIDAYIYDEFVYRV